MRVGIIGLGRAGTIHLEAWKAVPGAEVTAVCDTSPAGIRKARAAGVEAYEDPALMFDEQHLDAVSICTPPVDHAALTIAAIAEHLDVHPNTVRFHLDTLVADGPGEFRLNLRRSWEPEKAAVAQKRISLRMP